MESAILPFIAKVLTYSSVGAGVGYLLFRFLGQKWIEKKFAEKMADYTHAQTRELEELKFKISTLLDRVTKIHAKELEVLPEAWGLLNDAIDELTRFVSFFQSYPDLQRMSQPHLDEFLAHSALHEFEKDEVRRAGDRNEYYQRQIFFHDVRRVRQRYSEFRLYLRKNGIFMRQELKEKFGAVDDLMWDVLIKREIGQQIGDTKHWADATQKMRNEIEPIIAEIEEAVQKEIRQTEID